MVEANTIVQGTTSTRRGIVDQVVHQVQRSYSLVPHLDGRAWPGYERYSSLVGAWLELAHIPAGIPAVVDLAAFEVRRKSVRVE